MELDTAPVDNGAWNRCIGTRWGRQSAFPNSISYAAMFRWELEHMSVSDRMHALGDHAKSSRQPPLRPRPTAGGDLAAGSHFIDDSLTSSSIDDDQMKARLRQAIEDRANEEFIIPDDATIAAIADADEAQLI